MTQSPEAALAGEVNRVANIVANLIPRDDWRILVRAAAALRAKPAVSDGSPEAALADDATLLIKSLMRDLRISSHAARKPEPVDDKTQWVSSRDVLSRLAALRAKPVGDGDAGKMLVDLALDAARTVTRRAQRFCEELQEDGEGVPQPELKELHDALDKFEALDEQGEAVRELAQRIAALRAKPAGDEVLVSRLGEMDQSNGIRKECLERATYLLAMKDEGQSTIMRQSMETLFKAADALAQLPAASPDLPAISDAYLQGWSDCTDAACVPDDNTRMSDEQGLALYLKTKGVG